MRDTFEWIDGATDEDQMRHALYDLAAQQIAGQAATIIFARWTQANAQIARQTVEEVAGYVGVTGRRMTHGSETMVGDRAEQIVIRLLKMRQGFFRE